ncbi:MAG: TetR/AcrR family transcriptional regulator [Nitrosomonas sp.]|nr:TetR/AcrR family transcriptional regulator [Nitrosomonas sp.]
MPALSNSKPTLYYYFKDKESLFIEVLLHRLHGFREVIEKSGSLSQRLERIAVTIFDSFKADYSHLVHDLEHIKQQGNVAQCIKLLMTNSSLPSRH